jgi:hypothetical protein
VKDLGPIIADEFAKVRSRLLAIPVASCRRLWDDSPSGNRGRVSPLDDRSVKGNPPTLREELVETSAGVFGI